MVIFVPLERLFSVHPQKIFRKSLVVDLAYYFLNSLLPKTVLVIPMALAAWSLHSITPAALHRLAASLPLWARTGWWSWSR